MSVFESEDITVVTEGDHFLHRVICKILMLAVTEPSHSISAKMWLVFVCSLHDQLFDLLEVNDRNRTGTLSHFQDPDKEYC